MKVNRKTVLTTAAVLGVVALAAGGTIAYFTDKVDPVTNTFTVGDVEIEMYESQLHRENSGRAATFAALSSDPHYCDYNTNPTTYFGNANLIKTYDSARYCTPGMAEDTYSDSEDDISAIKNGHTATNRYWGFTDNVIKTDAATYQSGYLAEAAAHVVPGEWIRKFTYVENTSTTEPAYVLIRYMVPTTYAGNVTLKVPGTPYEETTQTGKPYFTAVTKDTTATTNAYTAYDVADHGDTIDGYTGYTETIDNVEYKVYAAVTTAPVNPGEMTFWSPVNTVKLNNEITETNVAPGTQVNVKVDAQAIQAKTFDSAIDAINNL